MDGHYKRGGAVRAHELTQAWRRVLLISNSDEYWSFHLDRGVPQRISSTSPAGRSLQGEQPCVSVH